MPTHASLWPTTLRLFAALSLFTMHPPRAEASGFFGPPVYLGEGGRLIEATPEFYWELEIRRLARAYRSHEKTVDPPDVNPFQGPETEQWPLQSSPGHRALFTAEQDRVEFSAALKEGRVLPADPALARRQHGAARDAILSCETEHPQPLLEEVPSEFADYHRGAYAFRRGEEHWAEARAAWEALLRRPREERHYRGVWAAHMLGTLSELEGDRAGAAEWFRQTRALARAGAADSLGLAADSYANEGAVEQSLGHLHKAAELYLTQVAIGQRAGLDALQQVVPRDVESDEWRAAAADPLLRKLTSMHQLAFGRAGKKPEEGLERSRRWVAMLQELKVAEADGAEYLGWVAYQVGDYALAQKWLSLAKSNTPAALWLRAKLLRRAGREEAAARAMLQAWKLLQDPEQYTQWVAPPEHPQPGGELEEDTADYSVFGEGSGLTFLQKAGGDYGALRLARGEFVPALEAFRKVGLWIDAAYIAEEVLTTNELIRHVEAQPPEPPVPSDEVRARSLRHLLGRRLMRDGRYAEAFRFLPAPYSQVARVYVQALRESENPKLPKAARARAYFRAGWLARYAGMEIMGTEGPPDGFASRGDFEADKIGAQRATGRYEEPKKEDAGGAGGAFREMALKPSPAELARLKKHTAPAVRFHYRFLGARLMMKAAPLLPDNSEELADVINRAGRIVYATDDALGERYFAQLERRCEKTEIGGAANAVHWFVPQSGRWCNEEKAALDKLLDRKPLPPETP